jgi:hypothetical protein
MRPVESSTTSSLLGRSRSDHLTYDPDMSYTYVFEVGLAVPPNARGRRTFLEDVTVPTTIPGRVTLEGTPAQPLLRTTLESNSYDEAVQAGTECAARFVQFVALDGAALQLDWNTVQCDSPDAPSHARVGPMAALLSREGERPPLERVSHEWALWESAGDNQDVLLLALEWVHIAVTAPEVRSEYLAYWVALELLVGKSFSDSEPLTIFRRYFHISASAVESKIKQIVCDELARQDNGVQLHEEEVERLATRLISRLRDTQVESNVTR